MEPSKLMAEPTTVAFKLNFDQLLSLAIKDNISEIWTEQKIWNISQLDRNLVYNIQTAIIKFMVSRENIKFKKKKKIRWWLKMPPKDLGGHIWLYDGSNYQITTYLYIWMLFYLIFQKNLNSNSSHTQLDYEEF